MRGCLPLSLPQPQNSRNACNAMVSSDKMTINAVHLETFVRFNMNVIYNIENKENLSSRKTILDSDFLLYLHVAEDSAG